MDLTALEDALLANSEDEGDADTSTPCEGLPGRDALTSQVAGNAKRLPGATHPVGAVGSRGRTFRTHFGRCRFAKDS